MVIHRTFLMSIIMLFYALSGELVHDSECREIQALPGTQPLTLQGDPAEQMVAGIDKFFMRELDASISRRSVHWYPDFSSHENYIKSLVPNRERFKRIIGVVDPREPVSMELTASMSVPALVGRGNGYKIFAVRWQVLKGVDAEGLLIQPDGETAGNVVALPDCDWTPEMLAGLTSGIPKEAQFARRLAENGFRVIVPALIDRQHTYSGNPEIRMTSQPHREFIYRAAYELGRHIIGYEVQKVCAAVDWFERKENGSKPVGVIGYGEGGLLAMYAAAVDLRIDAAAVLGYFQPRENVWREPIYRNVWGLLEEFGDAEIACLIAPRPLVIESCKSPEIVIPLQMPNRSAAAPGILTTPSVLNVEREVQRANRLIKRLKPPVEIRLIKTDDAPPGSDKMLRSFVESLGIRQTLTTSGEMPEYMRRSFDPERRHKRQFYQLLEHTQYLMRESEFRRAEFWSKADDSSPEAWKESTRWYRQYFWEEIIGRLPHASIPSNPRTRLVYDQPEYRGYEVVLDVYPDVFTYGILLVPKDIKPGERRPVVVCQHGLEGIPQHTADPGTDHRAYHQYACKLAERGFITYSPQNPYKGYDNFRVLIRKSHPLKKSLYAVIVRQHERTLEWLSGLPCVDPERIAFYGLSYGGKTAMRIPSILQGYCLSICSADFNEWIWKNVSVRHRYSYMFTIEYDMYEFNLGNTFNYAEMSWLICPRPFMVERGHHDGVAPDEWVAYEYAKTRRRYDLLNIGDKTRIEFFNGPHTINGVGTFEFLHKHLNWKSHDERCGKGSKKQGQRHRGTK